MVSSKHSQRVSGLHLPHPDAEIAIACSTQAQLLVEVHPPHPILDSGSGAVYRCGSGAFGSLCRRCLGGSGTASVPVVRAPFRRYDNSARAASFSFLSYSAMRSKVSQRTLQECISPLNLSISASSFPILFLKSDSRFI